MNMLLHEAQYNICVFSTLKWTTDLYDFPSSTDENEINTEMAIFAPLESDLDDSANSVQEHQVSLIFDYSSGWRCLIVLC